LGQNKLKTEVAFPNRKGGKNVEAYPTIKEIDSDAFNGREENVSGRGFGKKRSCEN